MDWKHETADAGIWSKHTTGGTSEYSLSARNIDHYLPPLLPSDPQNSSSSLPFRIGCFFFPWSSGWGRCLTKRCQNHPLHRDHLTNAAVALFGLCHLSHYRIPPLINVLFPRCSSNNWLLPALCFYFRFPPSADFWIQNPHISLTSTSISYGTRIKTVNTASIVLWFIHHALWCIQKEKMENNWKRNGIFSGNDC